MISDNNKVRISFNAVVETEVKQETEIVLNSDEIFEVLILGDFDKATKTAEIDEVDDVLSQQLNETLLGIVPDELKNDCVSMTFTDIKVTFLD